MTTFLHLRVYCKCVTLKGSGERYAITASGVMMPRWPAGNWATTPQYVMNHSYTLNNSTQHTIWCMGIHLKPIL